MKSFRLIKLIFVVFLFLQPTLTNAQKRGDPTTYRNIFITPPGKKIITTINIKGAIKPDRSKSYYWFDNNVIHETQGGYAGYLLDGDYAEFLYPANILLVQGKYKKGLKAGNWVKWYENGKIKEISNWKKGVMSGEKKLYNETGSLILSENYSDGKLVMDKTEPMCKNDEKQLSFPSKIRKGLGNFWSSITHVFVGKKNK